MPPSSLGPKSSEMDRKTVETSSLVRRVHISACFCEKRMSDSTCQRWDHPDGYQRSAKTSHCDGTGVHQSPQHGWSVNVRYHWCGCLRWNFGETYAAVKTTTFPRNSQELPRTTDCWAAQVLHKPRMGRKSTSKTVTINIFSSQRITKCNRRKGVATHNTQW